MCLARMMAHASVCGLNRGGVGVFSEVGWSAWLVWLLYAGLGVIFLGMLYYPLRRWPQWLLLLLLSPIAAILYTPLSIKPADDHWAPALLIMIVELEADGREALARGLYPMFLVWSGLLLIGAALLRRKQKLPHSQEHRQPPSQPPEPEQ